MKKNSLKVSVGLALDLGTSGFRAQSIDLKTGKVTGTVITLCNPLPGLNLMDQINSVLKMGQEEARKLITRTILLMIKELSVPFSKIERIAASGNSFQLSLFQNIEIRDLAFIGSNKRKELKIAPPAREGGIKTGLIAELPDRIDYIIPPCIAGMIGADGLAMLTETDFLKKGFSLAIDFGTNAEMALKNRKRIYFGSAAAGPAIEGQCLKSGRVASPGCLVDLEWTNGSFSFKVLDERMRAKRNLIPKWITGTGVVALLAVGIKNGLIRPPKILTESGRIDLTPSISVNEKELKKLGVAIGAIRAGFKTLLNQERVKNTLDSVYMAGALGTYLDARKALNLGLIPQSAKVIEQVGNTSLELAKRLVRQPAYLKTLQNLANQIKTDYVSFAESANFRNLFILELSKWTEGLPDGKYSALLTRFKLYEPKSKREPGFGKTKLEIKDQGETKIIKNIREIYD